MVVTSKTHFGRGLVLSAGLMALAGCSGEGGDQVALSGPLPNIAIADTMVFPESITSRADGTVLIGSVKGNVYKAEPGSDTATAWIETSPENGILTILGVLADEETNTLWLCSDPNFFGPERSQGVASVMAFDLD